MGSRFIYLIKWKWKSLSHLQLCDPMDYKVHGILPARILEWVAIPFSRGSSQPRDQTQVSCIIVIRTDSNVEYSTFE